MHAIIIIHVYNCHTSATFIRWFVVFMPLRSIKLCQLKEIWQYNENLTIESILQVSLPVFVLAKATSVPGCPRNELLKTTVFTPLLCSWFMATKASFSSCILHSVKSLKCGNAYDGHHTLQYQLLKNLHSLNKLK